MEFKIAGSSNGGVIYDDDHQYDQYDWRSDLIYSIKDTKTNPYNLLYSPGEPDSRAASKKFNPRLSMLSELHHFFDNQEEGILIIHDDQMRFQISNMKKHFYSVKDICAKDACKGGATILANQFATGISIGPLLPKRAISD